MFKGKHIVGCVCVWGEGRGGGDSVLQTHCSFMAHTTGFLGEIRKKNSVFLAYLELSNLQFLLNVNPCPAESGYTLPLQTV